MISKKGVKFISTMPFIYGMIFPSVVMHLGVEIYHRICFPIYGIPLVKSEDYFIYDRQLIEKLNLWQKVNCYYCSYVNNLIAYGGEIGARTERFWCPLKYERKHDHKHSQYDKFLEEGNCSDVREDWDKLRDFSDIK